MSTTTTYTNARKLLAQRKRASGTKKSMLTRKLRRMADVLCVNFAGKDVKNCRGCRIENQLQD